MLSANELLLDIGNTQIVAGLYDPETQRILKTIRMPSSRELNPLEFKERLAAHFQIPISEFRIGRTIATTVVAELTHLLRSAFDPLLLITADTQREFEIEIPLPSQMGTDRMVNIEGALSLAKPPFLIVDSGTATTFCLVSNNSKDKSKENSKAKPAFIGGAITPGLEISWKALQKTASRRFEIDFTRPASSVGNSTESQLQSGVFQAYEALIEGMADRLLQDAGPHFKNASLFVTGGCINYLKLSPRFRWVPELTLLGLIRYGQIVK